LEETIKLVIVAALFGLCTVLRGPPALSAPGAQYTPPVEPQGFFTVDLEKFPIAVHQICIVSIALGDPPVTVLGTNDDGTVRVPAPHLGEDGNLRGTLRACAQTPGTWVRFEAPGGTIHLHPHLGPIKIASDVVIDGRIPTADQTPHGGGRVTIVGTNASDRMQPFAMLIRDATNVVVSDVAFRADYANANYPRCADPLSPADSHGCGVSIVINGQSHNVWIDHCIFVESGDKAMTVWNSVAFKVPTDVTVSNSVFMQNFFGVLVGTDPATARWLETRGMEGPHVTFHGNLFYRINQRSPRCSLKSRCHIFNNLVLQPGVGWNPTGTVQDRYRGCAYPSGNLLGFAASVVGEGQAVVENNIFEANPRYGCTVALSLDEFDDRAGNRFGAGRARASGNLLLNGARFPTPASDPSVFTPPYRYELEPADERLRARILQGAGLRGYSWRLFE
jgi:pectate lyase